MKKISICLALILLFMCVFAYGEIKSESNNQAKQYTSTIIKSRTVHQVETAREIAETIVFFVIVIFLFVSTVVCSRKFIIENVRHTHHRKKHIKHLPRANILNSGIII